MPDSKTDLITSYCVGLVSAFKHLSQDLSIPQIDQELYSTLFIHPLEEQQCHNDDPSAASFVSTLNTSPSEMQAEALVSLGGTGLIVSALRAHEQQTLLVLQAIVLRENVVSRMWACCDAYKEANVSTREEARFTLLRLLQEHQIVTLLTVEAIFEWREILSRPYPFLLRGGQNYLLSIINDCAALDTQALVRSLANVRLRQDPLCAKIDLKRMQHRLETMRRSRLITTGALWNVGLHPLQPLQARSRSRSGDVGRRVPSGNAKKMISKVNGKLTERASLPVLRSPPPSAAVQQADRLFHFHGAKPDDFVSEVARLSSALKRSQGTSSGVSATPPISCGTSVSSSHPAGSKLKHYPAPCTPFEGDSAEARRKQHRLLTAARVIETEAGLYRKVMEELYDLAHGKDRFVPLLDIPQLFTTAGVPAAQGAALKVARSSYPADSWPLDRAQWPAVVAAEGRVDRLSCMSTAREALQTCDLLPAWQQRMGRRASEISGHQFNHSKSSTSSLSTEAGGLLTPLHTPHTGTSRTKNSTITTTTITAASATARAHSSTCSDSFEHTSAVSASELVVGTRCPVMAKPEKTSVSSSAYSTSPSSSSRSLLQREQDHGYGEAEKKEVATPVYSDTFSSDFESESDDGGSDGAKASEKNTVFYSFKGS